MTTLRYATGHISIPSYGNTYTVDYGRIIGQDWMDQQADKYAPYDGPLGPVEYGTGWQCCQAAPAKAIVFSNGSRWAVCLSCASRYVGTVTELPQLG